MCRIKVCDFCSDLPQRYVRSGHVNGEAILITDVKSQMVRSDSDRVLVTRYDNEGFISPTSDSNPIHSEFKEEYAKVYEFKLNRLLPLEVGALEEVVHTTITRMAITQEVDKLMGSPFAAITELEEQNNQLRSITDRHRREIKEFENMSIRGRVRYLWSGICQAITRK